MELNLSNASRVENTFYWDIPFVSYKIETVQVTTNEPFFRASYNHPTEQYLESGRPDESPVLFTGPFRVSFSRFGGFPYTPIAEIQSIQITVVEIE